MLVFLVFRQHVEIWRYTGYHSGDTHRCGIMISNTEFAHVSKVVASVARELQVSSNYALDLCWLAFHRYQSFSYYILYYKSDVLCRNASQRSTRARHVHQTLASTSPEQTLQADVALDLYLLSFQTRSSGLCTLRADLQVALCRCLSNLPAVPCSKLAWHSHPQKVFLAFLEKVGRMPEAAAPSMLGLP